MVNYKTHKDTILIVVRRVDPHQLTLYQIIIASKLVTIDYVAKRLAVTIKATVDALLTEL